MPKFGFGDVVWTSPRDGLGCDWPWIVTSREPDGTYSVVNSASGLWLGGYDLSKAKLSASQLTGASLAALQQCLANGWRPSEVFLKFEYE